MLPPLLFDPILKRIRWGGRRLGTVLGKPIGDAADSAESWELVDHGPDQSVVSRGTLAGWTLDRLVAEHNAALFGRHAGLRQFPLLVKFLDASGSGTMADAIDAIEFAMAVKQAFASTGTADVRVLSNSWGDYEFSQALLDEVLATSDADMLFVAGAGNDGLDNDWIPMYPASFEAPNVISVAATGMTAFTAISAFASSIAHVRAIAAIPALAAA